MTWQYHIDVEPQIIGLHFLALNAGYVISAATARRILRRLSIRMVACTFSALALASLAALSLAAPPMGVPWKLAALALVGIASGGLSTSSFYALEGNFSAATANRAGLLFGSGCLLSTLAFALTYFTRSLRLPTMLLSAVPLIVLLLFARKRSDALLAPVRTAEQDALRETLKDLRSIAAILFGLLLFFQFGNEWAIAGWLPLFLIHRLGSNPVFAVYTLAAYFLALMLGRVAATKLLRRANHRRLLISSMSAAMSGYLLLSFTNSLAGAWIAVVIIGAAYAPIYPLIAEKLDNRFSYHAGFYSGIFSIAMTGAMCAPWLLGYVDAYLGLRYVMLLPALGSIVVLILALLIMLESHLMTDSHASSRRA